MVKLSIFLTRRSDLTPEFFSAYWRDRHAPLLLSLPEFTDAARRYVQQHAVDGLPGDLPLASCDGVAEVWFDDLAAAVKALGSEMYATIVAADEENFLDRARTRILVTRERSII